MKSIICYSLIIINKVAHFLNDNGNENGITIVFRKKGTDRN